MGCESPRDSGHIYIRVVSHTATSKIVGTTDQGRFLLYKSSTVVTGARCPGPVHSRDFCAHPQSDKIDSYF